MQGDDDFDGSVVALGALGPVARLTLAVEPSYLVRQDVFAGLRWQVLFEHLPEIFASGYSVSLFTDWGDDLGQMWVKTRIDNEESTVVPDELFGARRLGAGTRITEANDNTTVQGGIPGPWSERLPHFRIDAAPSDGDEIQTEYLVPLEHATQALTALRLIAPSIARPLMMSELLTVAADELWMSPANRRDSLCIHFTWKRLPAQVNAVVAQIETALAPFDARPHWGKVFGVKPETLNRLYPKLPDFRDLIRRRDPSAKFGNAYLERVIGMTW